MPANNGATDDTSGGVRSSDRADLDLLVAAVEAAGVCALGYFGKTNRSWTKGHNSPVTEADIAVDRLLRERLTAARPDYGWLSEESEDSAERLQRRRLFVVDPIDGTKGFMKELDDWTICAAVVEDGRPVAAAILRPTTDELYTAVSGGGARRGTTPIATGGRSVLEGARLAGPKGLLPRHVAYSHEPWVHSLALRMIYVAEGRVDGAVARENARDWDLAAADLLIHEAGGRLTTLDGDPLSYNAAVSRHGILVAAGPGLLADLTGAVAEAVTDIDD